MITSAGNQQMKNIIQLQKKSKTRYQQRVFVTEGPRMAFEAPRDWVEKIYVSESFLRTWEERLLGYDYEIVSDSVMKTVSDTKTPQGVLCLVRMPEYGLEDLLPKPGAGNPHLLVLESIQDPGNLGTMVRTGEGAGISGILMNRTTADIFHPKVIRSTMGSIYRVPFFVADDLPAAIGDLKRQGIVLYGAHLEGSRNYTEMDYRGGVGFLIGNEGNGLSPEIACLADHYIRIPMEGAVESLNAAIASAVLMYEVKRQRSQGDSCP